MVTEVAFSPVRPSSFAWSQEYLVLDSVRKLKAFLAFFFFFFLSLSLSLDTASTRGNPTFSLKKLHRFCCTLPESFRANSNSFFRLSHLVWGIQLTYFRFRGDCTAVKSIASWNRPWIALFFGQFHEHCHLRMTGTWSLGVVLQYQTISLLPGLLFFGGRHRLGLFPKFRQPMMMTMHNVDHSDFLTRQAKGTVDAA